MKKTIIAILVFLIMINIANAQEQVCLVPTLESVDDVALRIWNTYSQIPIYAGDNNKILEAALNGLETWQPEPQYATLLDSLGEIEAELRRIAREKIETIVINTIPLLKDEYLVPRDVLKALKVVTSDSEWNDPWTNPGGTYLTSNFIPTSRWDFFPGTQSKGEKFKTLLKNNAGFSNEEVNRFYTLASTQGNLLLSRKGYRKEIHVHERIHKIINEQLTNEETTTLLEGRNEFRGWMITHEIGPDEFFMDEHFSGFLDTRISLGSWSELYAYMAQLEVFPSEDPNFRIDLEVYEEFEKQYPEAYGIYRKVIGIASNQLIRITSGSINFKSDPFVENNLWIKNEIISPLFVEVS